MKVIIMDLIPIISSRAPTIKDHGYQHLQTWIIRDLSEIYLFLKLSKEDQGKWVKYSKGEIMNCNICDEDNLIKKIAEHSGIDIDRIKNAKISTAEWIEITHIAAFLADENKCNNCQIK